MNDRLCDRIQQILAEGGPRALEDESQENKTAREHLELCDDCFELLERQAELDVALDALPPRDAPDDVVARLLARSELTTPTSPTEAPPAAPEGGRLLPFQRGLARLASSPIRFMTVAATVLVVSFVGFLFLVQGLLYMMPQKQADMSAVEYANVEVPASGELSESEIDNLQALGYINGGSHDDESNADKDKLRALGYLNGGSHAKKELPAGPSPEPSRPPASAPIREQLRRKTQEKANDVARRDNVLRDQRAAQTQKEDSAAKRQAMKPRRRALEKAKTAEDMEGDTITVTAERPVLAPTKLTTGSTVSQSELENMPSARDPWAVHQTTPDVQTDRIYVGGKGRASETAADPILTGGVISGEAEGEETTTDYDEAPPALSRQSTSSQSIMSRAAVDDFWRQRSQIDGLVFQDATGYWANTYVPGDPSIRHLAMRLLEQDNTSLEALVTEPLRLHNAARQTSLPLDPPGHAALAVYLHADRPTVREPTRMLVQVGVQGTPRYGGRRPAMNVGVVLDLRHDLSPADWASARALCTALVEARDLGDSFRLVVAGRPRPDTGLDVLGPDDFRHGPMTVAFERLAQTSAKVANGEPVLSLTNAFQSTLMAVAAIDDPTRPLGSSVVSAGDAWEPRRRR